MNENYLEHKETFRNILKDYSPSDESIAMLKRMKMMVMCGPTGAGRNTIIKNLVDTGDFAFFPSDTTRQPRYKDGVLLEPNGSTYWFISEYQMLKQLQSGEMIEAAIIHDQQVSGANIKTLQQISGDGKIAVSEIEEVGVRTYKALNPDIIAVFIIPPDFEEWMKRIHQRSDISKQELINRLTSSISEMQAAVNDGFFHIFINDDVRQVSGDIHELGIRGDSAPNNSPEVLEVLADLLEKAKELRDELKA